MISTGLNRAKISSALPVKFTPRFIELHQTNE